FTNAGTVNWTSGSLTLNEGSNFTNNGVVNDKTDHTVYGNGGKFTKTGSYVKSAGNGETHFSIAFNNSGSVEVKTGSLILDKGGTADGSFVIAPLATLKLNAGSFTFSASSSIAGSGTAILNASTTIAGTYDLQTGTTKIPNTFVMVNFTGP